MSIVRERKQVALTDPGSNEGHWSASRTRLTIWRT